MRIAALLLSAITVLVVAGLTGQDPPVTAVVSGVVTRAETSLPMAEVLVTLTPPGATGPARFAAATDARGSFRIEADPGTYEIAAELAGYYEPRDASPVRSVTLAPGGTLEGLALRLARGLAISGTVFDELGEPLGGASVRAVQPGYDRQGHRRLDVCRGEGSGVAESDADGKYRIYGLEAGAYYVVVSRGCGIAPPPSYYPGTVEVTGAVSLSVGGGNDLGGIDIRVPESDLFQARFRIEGPPLPDRTATPVVRILRRHANDWIEVMTRAGSTASRSSLGAAPLVPDGDELWRTPGLPPGAYTFYYSPNQSYHWVGQVDFVLSDRDVDVGTMIVHDTVFVSGRARTEESVEADLTGVVLRAVPVEGPALVFRETTSRIRQGGDFDVGLAFTGISRGRWEIDVEGLPPDIYLASARIGGRDMLSEGLVIDTDEPGLLELVFDGPGGLVEGLVRDARGAPSVGAQVVLVPSRPRWRNSTFYRTARTDQLGRFAVRGVAPDDYQVFAWEAVEPNAWLNEDFRRRFETRAVGIQVSKSGREMLEVAAIPAGP